MSDTTARRCAFTLKRATENTEDTEVCTEKSQRQMKLNFYSVPISVSSVYPVAPPDRQITKSRFSAKGCVFFRAGNNAASTQRLALGGTGRAGIAMAGDAHLADFHDHMMGGFRECHPMNFGLSPAEDADRFQGGG